MKDTNNERFVVSIEPDNPKFTIEDALKKKLIKAKLIGHDFVRFTVIDLESGQGELYDELDYDNETLDRFRITNHNYLKKSRLEIFCDHVIEQYIFILNTDPDAYAI